jgi:hypothetical protein
LRGKKKKAGSLFGVLLNRRSIWLINRFIIYGFGVKKWTLLLIFNELHKIKFGCGIMRNKSFSLFFEDQHEFSVFFLFIMNSADLEFKFSYHFSWDLLSFWGNLAKNLDFEAFQWIRHIGFFLTDENLLGGLETWNFLVHFF